MRSGEGAYLVDGPLLLQEALDAGQPLDCIYLERDGAADRVLEVAAAAERAGVRVADVVPGALSSVLELTTPQSVVGVLTRPDTSLEQVVGHAVATRRPLLVLAELSDPGNVGTLVRIAEAAGCAGVVLSERTADLFNPKTVRASAGALFRVRVAVDVPVDAVLAELAAASVPSVATVGAGGIAPEQVELAGASALWLGNEAHGLDAQVLDACTTRVTIPMEGSVESLNAAMAGAVVAFEAARQRRAGIGVAG